MLVFMIICGLLLLAIAFALGYILAAASVWIRFEVGTLHIDESSPVTDAFLFEIKDFNKLYDRKYALLKVEKTREDQTL